MSNVGRWTRYYAEVLDPRPYGDTKTYQMGAEFLKDCDVIEDWGCGTGWFRKLAQTRGLNVTNVDGSYSPFCDKIRDLEHYRPEGVDGIFIRHVLEHNYAWDKILTNALQSAGMKVALVLFTPPSKDEDVHQIAFVKGYNVPDLSFPPGLIERMFHDHLFHVEHSAFSSGTWYGQEHVFLGTRVAPPGS